MEHYALCTKRCRENNFPSLFENVEVIIRFIRHHTHDEAQ